MTDAKVASEEVEILRAVFSTIMDTNGQVYRKKIAEILVTDKEESCISSSDININNSILHAMTCRDGSQQIIEIMALYLTLEKM